MAVGMVHVTADIVPNVSRSDICGLGLGMGSDLFLGSGTTTTGGGFRGVHASVSNPTHLEKLEKKIGVLTPRGQLGFLRTGR